MIMVLMGGSYDDREAAICDLMQLYKGRIQCINVGNIPNPEARVERLQLEIKLNRPFRTITVVNNPSSVEEVNELRRVGACFAHVYGPLFSIYDHIAVERHDEQIAPTPHCRALPSHVLTPEEAVSEFMLRGRPDR